jgi:hypothetical protein
MPETAMHKHNRTVPAEHDIRTTGQIFAMEPKTKSKAMQNAANRQFRPGVAATDAPHNMASLFRRSRIHCDPNTERI